MSASAVAPTTRRATTTTDTAVHFVHIAPRLVFAIDGTGVPGGAAFQDAIGALYPVAYALNFAAVPLGALGYLTAWPAGQTQPGVASLNAPTGTVTDNAAIVPAGANGAVSVYVLTQDTPCDVIIDVNGYFAP